MNVLDVGCGNNPRGNVNLDINKPETKIRNFVLATAYNLPFATHVIDKIICIYVLEHLEKPEKAIYEMSRVCNGEAVILVPHRRTQSWKYAKKHGHIAFFDVGWFEKVFKRLNIKTFFVNRLNRKVPHKYLPLFESTWGLDVRFWSFGDIDAEK